MNQTQIDPSAIIDNLLQKMSQLTLTNSILEARVAQLEAALKDKAEAVVPPATPVVVAEEVLAEPQE